MDQLPPPLIISLIAAGTLIGALLYSLISRRLLALRIRRRFRRGAEGESRAAEFLLQHGFTILGTQVETTPCMWVDGKKVHYTIRADYLVKKAGRNAVVEVKTGSQAVDPASSGTRRQILEYSHFYDVDDIYLFDAEKRHLKNIRFDRFRPFPMGWIWTGALMGFLVGFLARDWSGILKLLIGG